ncbi:MAG: BolA/IbaG family iron-sulfur metabolism protein, partial [Gammaproteobacteria bacterium]|nr:BolA/IbaG family iron-sulfur metabolism protein [Gammaproteobacteria bacterium]
MELSALKAFIEQNITCDHVRVNGDGRHFNAVIVSANFEGLNTFKRQQTVYAFLSAKIASG